MIARADALRLPFADRSMDLVIGSPPYSNARLYLEDRHDPGISRDTRAWVDWMLDVTTEALRVSKGLVLWVVAGVTRGRNYQPGPEGLTWRWWERGGECHCLRPVIWHRFGIPGSGQDQWFRGDCEYVLAFKRPGRLPWADNTANGTAPVFPYSKKFVGERRDGDRIGVKKGCGGRRTDGKSKGLEAWADLRGFIVPEVTNPGNFFSTGASGGGNLGNPLAHRNEAPYPVDVPAWFVASHCPPGGRVLDPFVGSGTTVDAALTLGRTGIGCDIRQSQCLLSRKRIGTVTPGFCFAEEVP